MIFESKSPIYFLSVNYVKFLNFKLKFLQFNAGNLYFFNYLRMYFNVYPYYPYQKQSS